MEKFVQYNFAVTAYRSCSKYKLNALQSQKNTLPKEDWDGKVKVKFSLD